MKEFTLEDLKKMSDKEALLLCIAHWKNILKAEEKVGDSLQSQKIIPFTYKGKLVDPDIFTSGCVLCELTTNCEKCIMYQYWSGKFNTDHDSVTCMRENSVFISWLCNKKDATKSVLKALRHRLHIMQKGA